MRTNPASARGALILIVALSAIACGSSSTSSAPTAGTSASTGTQPSASTGGGSPSIEPSDSAQPTAASPSAGGGGGGGNGTVPPIADGDWTSGKAHAEVTGGVTATLDGDIRPGLATSLGDNTTLIYFAADNTSQIAVAITNGVAAVSVISPAFVAGGGTTVGAECQVNITKLEAKAIEGTITCNGAPVLEQGSTTAKKANIVASFNASR